MNTVVKWIYLGVNLGVFYLTDHLLSNKFVKYGRQWIRWSVLSNQEAFHYKTGVSVKPGNRLLPTFGFCEIFEASVSETFVYKNKSRFICEISLNVMYQYIFLILWFFMLAGIVISSCGVVQNLANHLITFLYILRNDPEGGGKPFLRNLSFRECEYLSVIRRRDNQLYREMLELLALKGKPSGVKDYLGVSPVNGDYSKCNGGNVAYYGKMSPMKMLWTILNS